MSALNSVLEKEGVKIFYISGDVATNAIVLVAHEIALGKQSYSWSYFHIFVLFMSYSTLDKVSKLVPNLEYLFSFNLQLKNAVTKFCFLGHHHAIKVP